MSAEIALPPVAEVRVPARVVMLDKRATFHSKNCCKVFANYYAFQFRFYSIGGEAPDLLNIGTMALMDKQLLRLRSGLITAEKSVDRND